MRRPRVLEEGDPELDRPNLRAREWDDEDERAFQRQHTVSMVKFRNKTLRTAQPVAGIEYAYTTSDDPQTPTRFVVNPERVVNSFASRAGSELKYFDTWWSHLPRYATGRADVGTEAPNKVNTGLMYLAGNSSQPKMLETSPKVFTLNSLVSGSGPYEREGRSAYFSSVSLQGIIRIRSHTTSPLPYGGFFGTFVLVLDKQFSGVPAGIEDVFTTINPYASATSLAAHQDKIFTLHTRNLARVTRFEVVLREDIYGSSVSEGKATTDEASYVAKFDAKAKLDFTTDYLDTVGLVDSHQVDSCITRNALLLYFLSPHGYVQNFPEMLLHARLRFRG